MFVGNLSFDTGEDQLRELFTPIGEVLAVSIPTDRDSGRARGFAFVELSTPKEAAAAIEQLNGRELDGRQLRVNGAEDRPSAPRSFGQGGRPAGGPAFRPRPKGSRRNVRARKRSIW
ncbi:MAG: RNA recognition motif domain-containing protein [Burkholderiales bacterium]